MQKLHWSPSELEEWLEADQRVKALYYASTELKAKHDKQEAEKLKRGGKRKR